MVVILKFVWLCINCCVAMYLIHYFSINTESRFDHEVVIVSNIGKLVNIG